jgi:hypothetical protein
MSKVIGEILAYTYGTAAVGTSSISLKQPDDLKVTLGFTAADEQRSAL